MKINLPDREVKVFTVLYRNEEIASYGSADILEIIKLSEAFRYTGLLLFESNRGNIEPWVFAQIVLSNTNNLCPFIAVNPVYMHPFTAAKKILSLSKFYNRKVYINFISGTAKNDLSSLGDNLNREQRYARLEEYIKIVDFLLRSGKSLDFTGSFYNVNGLMLSDRLYDDLLPEYFIAGSSIEASKLNQTFSSTSFFMANPSDNQDETYKVKPLQKKGIHFGLITRPTEKEARHRFDELFPSDDDGEEMLRYSMTNTDAKWKTKMFESSGSNFNNTYTLSPFKNFKSDCPYLVGDYTQVGAVIERYIINGASSLVIEIPGGQKEFEHIHNCLKVMQERLLNIYYN